MTVAIHQLAVPRQMRLVHQGQAVVIIVEIIDAHVTAALFDPTHIPTISIYNPLGIQIVSNEVMVQSSLGVYKYVYQTTMLDPLGLYTVSIIAVDLDEVAIIERVVAFKIIRGDGTAFPIFTYFGIKDQDNVVWYWHIASDNTMAFSSNRPSWPGRRAVEIDVVGIPSWLEINNPSLALRYVYPVLSGEFAVTDTQPLNGFGYVGSPTFVSISGGSFTIALNASEEVILTPVV